MVQNFRPVEWAYQTNIYEVNLRQYTEEGTIRAFTDHLPRLKDMGVETLWFMPLQPVGLLNRKGVLGSYYSISDYTSLNPEFGSESDFKNLVILAHDMGFKIIIDWVANHTSWDHVWTKTNPDFYSKTEEGNFKPPYPDWEDVIHLNYNQPGLRTAMIESMQYWVKEFNIDGFRCDMAHLVPLDFWNTARTELDKVKKLFWLAETEEPVFHEVFDASYTWEFLHKMEAYWKRETDIDGLYWVLTNYENRFGENSLRIYFTSNHDENSHSGSEYERMGNAAKAFAVLCATWKGIPLIYSGQELPLKKRLAFFEKDRIEWRGQAELHEFYKKLLNLHTNHPALSAAQTETYRLETNLDNKVFSFLRKKDEQEIIVVINLSSDNLQIKIQDVKLTGSYKNVFTSAHINFPAEEEFEILAWDFLLFEK